MNCVDECPESGLQFRFFPGTASTAEGPNLKRRAALTGLAAGVAAVPLLRSNAGFATDRHERLIRPPGALVEGRFLARCIRCGECMKACPNNALQPTFSEAGLEGIWTPVVAPRIGYCEPSCSLCGQVCPTGANWEFTSKEKAWSAGSDAKPIRIGTAFYDRGRCLPWAMATECIVCEEWCPTSPKAVYLRPAEVFDASGNAKQVRQPYIDPERCVGCGACEYACPVHDRPAVYVTSAGESRSKANQMLLRPSFRQGSWFPDEAVGWKRSGEVRVFPAADLWKYIDGDAERYLQAGVRQTQTANYVFQGKIEAVADVYRMSSAEGAAKIFDGEPAAASRPAAIGDGGRSYGQSLTFHKGPFFVRVTAFEDSPSGERALENLARAIELRLARL
jgi:ferredoxin